MHVSPAKTIGSKKRATILFIYNLLINETVLNCHKSNKNIENKVEMVKMRQNKLGVPKVPRVPKVLRMPKVLRVRKFVLTLSTPNFSHFKYFFLTLSTPNFSSLLT